MAKPTPKVSCAECGKRMRNQPGLMGNGKSVCKPCRFRLKEDTRCIKGGCTKPVHGRRLCHTHHQAWHKSIERTITCQVCGETATVRSEKNRVTCSTKCRDALGHVNRKYDMADAVARGDGEMVIEMLRRRSRVTDSGCWEHQSADSRGYRIITVAGKSTGAHRLAAQFSDPEFAPELQVHHKCANPSCCNPDHLRVVTPAENNAEMSERNFYLRRINALEGALRVLDDQHPLLAG